MPAVEEGGEMSTWNTIARSKRVEWRRKQTWGPFGPGFGISLQLDTSRWDADLDFAFRQLTALPKQDEARPLSSRLVGE